MISRGQVWDEAFLGEKRCPAACACVDWRSPPLRAGTDLASQRCSRCTCARNRTRWREMMRACRIGKCDTMSKIGAKLLRPRHGLSVDSE
eukprot:2287350-Pleurochrysis_carterae.AAC.4